MIYNSMSIFEMCVREREREIKREHILLRYWETENFCLTIVRNWWMYPESNTQENPLNTFSEGYIIVVQMSRRPLFRYCFLCWKQCTFMNYGVNMFTSKMDGPSSHIPKKGNDSISVEVSITRTFLLTGWHTDCFSVLCHQTLHGYKRVCTWIF